MSDIQGLIYGRYQDALKRAQALQKQGKLQEAAEAYQRTATEMRQYAKLSADSATRQKRLEQAAEFDSIAEKLLAPPEVEPPAGRKNLAGPGVKKLGKSAAPQGTPLEDDYEVMMEGLIETSTVQWKDIAGLDDTKRTIKLSYGLALARKPKGKEFKTFRNLLFFGPPGTGKTMLAAATAGSLKGSTFFNVKVSSLLSKYFGESSKMITALYQVARRHSPAVIFLDEFEGLSPARDSGESSAWRSVVSSLLSALEGLDAKQATDQYVLTLAATNTPWLLDAAILSRFGNRIYIPLPDTATRRGIFELQLTRKGHNSQAPLDELVRRTEGFSGREIEQICQIALSEMVARMNKDLMDIVDQGYDALKKHTLKTDDVCEADFSIAFKKIQPRTSPKMLQAYEDWNTNVDK